ncbi:MAG: TauD/TfdA family dioxygenase [Ilumatobacter sp.]|uniref:TauD/TfdA dioxygenase family protein n=1 Tax=Ilumatobacter sp. TaxID=1967498 RepID=UPI003C746BBC
MGIDVTPSGQACGATLRGVDLRDIDDATVTAIRSAWLDHKVLAFPDQDLSDDDLEAFTLRFGPFGEDPFFASIDGHPNIAAIRRTANETSSLFAENWHADWSFQEFPPDGTCLYGKTIPPIGGDTLFTDQQAALAAMPSELRERIEGRTAIHSARGGYAPDGTYGDDDANRSMQIRPSDDAYATQLHPLIRTHPETGAATLYSVLGYIIGIDGMDDDPADVEAARSLLGDLYHWQTREEFQYRHRWEPDMLVMWDNRCVLHRATGGYEGHERLLHRTTIGYNADVRTG